MAALPPRVVLVEDDEDFREAVKDLLEASGYRVDAFSSAEAFLSAGVGDAGCLVLDVELPGMRGPELQAELAQNQSRVPVLFLTGHADVPTVVMTVKAGARDVLQKPVDAGVLLDRVAEAVKLQRDEADAARALERRLGGLTPREREVLELALEGLSNKEIAARLGTSHRTVEVHRARAMKKTGTTRLLELSRLLEATRRPPRKA